MLRVGWWRYHDSTRYGYRKQRNDKYHALRLLAPATKNKWPKGYKYLRDLSIIRSALLKTSKPHAPPCSSQLSYVLETKNVQNISQGDWTRPFNFWVGEAKSLSTEQLLFKLLDGTFLHNDQLVILHLLWWTSENCWRQPFWSFWNIYIYILYI